MFKTTLVAVAIAVAAPAYAQVRVITGGGVEHVYGPGGQLQDDDELKARNERAEKELQVKRDKAAQEAAAESKRQKALADQAAGRALGAR
jgi:hypothetical protein